MPGCVFGLPFFGFLSRTFAESARRLQLGRGGILVKLAVTARSMVMVTVHVWVPVQAPPHPLNVDPDAGVAVKLMMLPLA